MNNLKCSAHKSFALYLLSRLLSLRAFKWVFKSIQTTVEVLIPWKSKYLTNPCFWFRSFFSSVGTKGWVCLKLIIHLKCVTETVHCSSSKSDGEGMLAISRLWALSVPQGQTGQSSTSIHIGTAFWHRSDRCLRRRSALIHWNHHCRVTRDTLNSFVFTENQEVYYTGYDSTTHFVINQRPYRKSEHFCFVK